jgi:hypothetical protein
VHWWASWRLWRRRRWQQYRRQVADGIFEAREKAWRVAIPQIHGQGIASRRRHIRLIDLKGRQQTQALHFNVCNPPQSRRAQLGEKVPIGQALLRFGQQA